jgi:pimeloyl-ACP methyl ester carboxylesterase
MRRSTLAAVLATASTLACSPSFHSARDGAMPGAPPGATYAEVDGVRLRYLDRPAAAEGGEPVVFVHGFASSLETWEGVIPAVNARHRVLALDLKGFGWSERPEGDYSPEAEAKLVLDLMKQRGIERATVVAHSWGSSVALAMALAAPQQVARLALYDAWVYEAQVPTFFLWAREPGLGEALFSLFYTERADERVAYGFYDKEKYVTEPFVEAVERALERPGTVAAALAAVRGHHFADVEGRYKDVKVETLLLWGREDEVTLLPFGERLSKDLPNARLVVYPQCGHFPMIEAAAASTNELVSFLSKPIAAPAQPKATPTEKTSEDEP